MEKHRVVIIGGGFAGLNVAKSLAKAPVEITLIDRRNHHLFQPLLYQVATGGLSPADISAPIRALLGKQKNARVLLANVTGFDAQNKQVHLGNGDSLPYDTLVLATGMKHSYFGNDQWAKDAPGLKSLDDARAIRHKVLLAFEEAEKTNDPAEREAWLTFAIVGAGPTGVELAGALAELSRHSLKNDFRNIDPTQATILLLDGNDRSLPTFDPNTSQKAGKALEKLGVTLRTGVFVSAINGEGLSYKRGEQVETIATKTVLWAAGVKASGLGKTLADQVGCEVDRMGRVLVQPDFSLPGASEVFVLGDLAAYKHENGQALPGTAAVALQEGIFLGKLLKTRLKGKPEPKFKYLHYGDLAVIGRSAAVADVGKLKLSGHMAWWFWLVVHLMKLVDFQNRTTVMLQWAWSYWTRKSAARLISHELDELNRSRAPKHEDNQDSHDHQSKEKIDPDNTKKSSIRLIA